jgi:hypothetical protein
MLGSGQIEKRPRQMKSRPKSKLIIFFDSKWIVHNKFVLAGQSFPHTAATFTATA